MWFPPGIQLSFYLLSSYFDWTLFLYLLSFLSFSSLSFLSFLSKTASPPLGKYIGGTLVLGAGNWEAPEDEFQYIRICFAVVRIHVVVKNEAYAKVLFLVETYLTFAPFFAACCRRAEPPESKSANYMAFRKTIFPFIINFRPELRKPFSQIVFSNNFQLSDRLGVKKNCLAPDFQPGGREVDFI